MVLRNNRPFRRLTQAELDNLGYSTKVGSRYINLETGEIVSRRQAENQRVRSLGYQSYSEYQKLNKRERLENDILYQTFQHILSTKAPGIPIAELQSPRSVEGQRLRSMYAEAVRTRGRNYNELLDFLDLPNERVNQDWEEIWQRYKGYLPMTAV